MTEAISLFSCFNKSCYTIWDSDYKEGRSERPSIQANRNILNCYECTPEDYPDISTAEFTCVHKDLENTIRSDFGDGNFDKVLFRYCSDRELGKGKYVLENSMHVKNILNGLYNEGLTSPTLENIVSRIMEKYYSIE